jgi:hypothetical protein
VAGFFGLDHRDGVGTNLTCVRALSWPERRIGLILTVFLCLVGRGGCDGIGIEGFASDISSWAVVKDGRLHWIYFFRRR